MHHRMQQMNPRVRMRSGHPQELSLHLWEEILLHVGQDEKQLVGRRRERTGVIRMVAAARAGLPVNRAGLPLDHKRLLERRQQCHKVRFRHAGHRAETPGTSGDVLIAWHTHLPPSMSDRGKMGPHKP